MSTYVPCIAISMSCAIDEALHRQGRCPTLHTLNPTADPRLYQVSAVQTGEVSAEAAAGLYLEQRSGQLQALHLLFQSQACCEDLPEEPAFRALGQFNSLLLKCPPGAKSGALHALMDAAKVGSFVCTQRRQ